MTGFCPYCLANITAELNEMRLPYIVINPPHDGPHLILSYSGYMFSFFIVDGTITREQLAWWQRWQGHRDVAENVEDILKSMRIYLYKACAGNNAPANSINTVLNLYNRAKYTNELPDWEEIRRKLNTWGWVET